MGASERFRLVSPRTDALGDLTISNAQWDAFQIPIDMVFLFRSSAAGRSIAIYPSPAGHTKSLLSLEAWNDLAETNPVLAELDPDVEARSSTERTAHANTIASRSTAAMRSSD